MKQRVKWEKVQANVLLQIHNQGFRGCVFRGENRIPLGDGEKSLLLDDEGRHIPLQR